MHTRTDGPSDQDSTIDTIDQLGNPRRCGVYRGTGGERKHTEKGVEAAPVDRSQVAQLDSWMSVLLSFFCGSQSTGTLILVDYSDALFYPTLVCRPAPVREVPKGGLGAERPRIPFPDYGGP